MKDTKSNLYISFYNLLEEAELLMKLWLDDFKEIIKNFENLKKVNPKEFSVQLREISDTINAFKQKIGIQ